VKLTDLDLDALARAVAPLVAARLASALRGVDAPPYSTRHGHGPEAWGERRWRAVAPTIPGAYRPAGTRWTLVPRAAFDAWLASQAPAPAPTVTPAAPWHPSHEAGALDARRREGR